MTNMSAEVDCPSSSSPTYAATTAPPVVGGAEQAELVGGSVPSPETQLKPVHSNYVPAQVDKHLEFLDFSSSGDLVVGSSSLTTRYWTGQLWYYSRAGHGDKGESATDPTACLTGLEMETGVVGGHFLTPTQILVGLDSGALALVNLTKEVDGDRLTHYLEVQSPVTEHDDQLLALSVWPQAGGGALVATVGADLRLNVLDSNLALVHSYLPAHERLITGLACCPTESSKLATTSQDGTVKVWDTRLAKPCQTVHRSPLSPPSAVTWSGDKLLVGSRSGALQVLDPRTPGKEAIVTGQFFDREVRRLRWDGAGRRVAVSADDTVVKVVEVRDTAVVEVYQDRRHGDFVRALAWRGDSLWSGGWDRKVLTHCP